MSMMSAQSSHSPIAEAHQLRGDRVPVGLVVNQDAAERIAGRRVQRFQQQSKVGVVISHDPSSAFNVMLEIERWNCETGCAPEEQE
jgi:hypothetical protein